MYVVYSNYVDKSKYNFDIKPVLSLKSRITSVKMICKGELVSYGRSYVANKDIKIATVSIGYADSYPRNLQGTNVKVVVNNKYATIIGRICMDQLIVDVSNIKDVKQGDIVTLIGEKRQILAEVITKKYGTITNELLSRLGDRLERVVINY